METTDQSIGLYIADAFAQEGFRESLQLIADGVRAVAGFDVAVVSVLRDTDEFEFIAVSGDDDAAAALIGHFNPRAHVMADLESGEDWGRFRFVPATRQDYLTELTWIPEVHYPDAPDAWHPENLLSAPLYDEQGRLIGLLGVDLPQDGRLPGADHRRILDLYAYQADRVLTRALAQARLSTQVRLATAARELVRNASSQMDVDDLLRECEQALVDAFGARGLWIQVFDDDEPTSTIASLIQGDTVVPEDLDRIARRTAVLCWEQHRVGVVSKRRGNTGLIDTTAHDRLLEFLSSIGRSSILFAPMGAGPRCVGILSFTRNAEDPEWTDAEAAAALDIGHDLGRVVSNARTFARDRELVAKLEELDRYKGSLIATITHEFKNPLTAIGGHLEMLEETQALDDMGRHSVEAMQRGTERLGSLVDDLLLLSKVSDPQAERQLGEVDLRKPVLEAVQLMAMQASSRAIGLTSELPADAVPITGVDNELEIVCTNLISNAVKYTQDGGTVTVRLITRDDQAVLAVADTGIGISADDQAGLFHEFFRSTNPEAHLRPGTGLGLAIVKGIVENTAGTVEVSSEVGVGSTFTVRLPLAGPAPVTSARHPL